MFRAAIPHFSKQVTIRTPHLLDANGVGSASAREGHASRICDRWMNSTGAFAAQNQKLLYIAGRRD
jgi:hypothetical protein